MKITDMKVYAYVAKHSTPISNGKYTYGTTQLIICQLFTDAGIIGYGTAHDNIPVVVDTLNSMKERVIGQDPFNYERIWDSLYLPKVYGRKGFETRALSCLDIALWDIMGKVAGRPIRQLLGGYNDSIPAYMAGGYYAPGKGLKELQEEVMINVRKGAKAIKMKIGGVSIAEDIERIDAVRDAIGKDVLLLVDANNAYNRIDALKMGRALDQRDIYWFEEPLSPDDIEGCAELCRKLDTPIAIGENEYTRWGFKQLVDAHAAQILNADACVLGGISEWKKVADYASASHILMAPHGDQEVHVHLVSAVSNGLIAEYYDSNLNELLNVVYGEHMLLDEKGHISAPMKPGLGVDIQLDKLEQYRVYPAK